MPDAAPSDAGSQSLGGADADSTEGVDGVVAAAAAAFQLTDDELDSLLQDADLDLDALLAALGLA